MHALVMTSLSCYGALEIVCVLLLLLSALAAVNDTLCWCSFRKLGLFYQVSQCTHLTWYWVNWLVSGNAASFNFNVTWITNVLTTRHIVVWRVTTFDILLGTCEASRSDLNRPSDSFRKGLADSTIFESNQPCLLLCSS